MHQKTKCLLGMTLSGAKEEPRFSFINDEVREPMKQRYVIPRCIARGPIKNTDFRLNSSLYSASTHVLEFSCPKIPRTSFISLFTNVRSSAPYQQKSLLRSFDRHLSNGYAHDFLSCCRRSCLKSVDCCTGHTFPLLPQRAMLSLL